MKYRSSLLAALGVVLLGGVVATACTSPQRAYGPDTGIGGGGGSGGSASTGATMSVGTGTTSMVPCAVFSDCPGRDTECQKRVCEGGMCGISFSLVGVGITAQNAGDCLMIVCDGLGELTQVVDDTDLPVDSNPCTKDVCAKGVPSNPPVSFGTTCGGTLTCDNQGNCTGCTSPGECPGTDNDCQTRSCTTSGVCGFIYAIAGTKVMEQTASDCKKNVCNGKGGTSVTFESTDIGDDGNSCTLDGCSNGSPTHANLPAGAPCQDVKGKPYCNGAGACVKCVTDATCPGQDTECQKRTCASGVCAIAFMPEGTLLAAQTVGDCTNIACDGAGGVKLTPNNYDVLGDSNPCTTESCSNGAVVHSAVAPGVDCGAPKTCDGVGNCTGCTTANDCAGADNECQTRTCISGSCGYNYVQSGTPVGKQPLGDCKKSICDGAGNTVIVSDDSDITSDGKECTIDSCSGGSPMFPPANPGHPCSEGGGAYCNTSGGCGVCYPGEADPDPLACCGKQTSFCCDMPLPAAPRTKSDPVSLQSGEAASDPLIPPGGLCCCGAPRYCNDNGTWDPCAN